MVPEEGKASDQTLLKMRKKAGPKKARRSTIHRYVNKKAFRKFASRLPKLYKPSDV